MNILRRSLWASTVAVSLTAFLVAALSATPEENTAIEALRKTFADGLYEATDRQAEEFVTRFQNSEFIPEVWLIQARARIQLGRVDDAIATLARAREQAKEKLDEFEFWQATALAAKGDWNAAAESFGRFLETHQTSPLRLQAAYAQAHAKHRAGNTTEAINLLTSSEGVFRKAAAANPTDAWAQRGLLLLAEMQLSSGRPNEAATALAQLTTDSLSPEFAWYRSYLASRVHAAAGQWTEALGYLTNLWTAVTNTVAPDAVGLAALLEGEAFERIGQPQNARVSYERALAKSTPSVYRRMAMERIIALASDSVTALQTIKWLESFVAAHPGDELADLATFSIGQLCFSQYGAMKSSEATTPIPTTNLLQEARTNFELVITNHPGSPFIGQAYLYRGLTLWEEGTNHLSEAMVSFKSALEKLSEPALQSVARFKLADTQVLLGDLVSARSNYWFVATNQQTTATETNSLSLQALFQVVRTSIDMNDIANAATASQRLIELDPRNPLAERAALLLGQAQLRLGNPQAARSSFESFITTFTNSQLLAEVRLAIAKTYEQQNSLAEAINLLKSWIESHSGNTNVPTALLAQAHFDLARLSYRAKPDTNAIVLLSEFCAKFPDNVNVPLAQYLIGEYYYGQGDYGKAELQFQNRALVQNTNAAVREIIYRARLMAGRAAVARQSYRSAREHFDWIITNGPLHVASSPIPVPIVAEAYLLRGDTFAFEQTGSETNNLARFGEAINAYSKVAENWPTNDLAPIAWGRIGECHLQLATQDPKRYDMAADAFSKVIQSTANITIRSQAELELGVTREKQAALLPERERQALLDQAMDHYLRVLYGRNLRPGESPDPYWVKRAGLAAAELAESQKKFDVAMGVYRRLLTEIPTLRARLEKKIEELAKMVAIGTETNRSAN